MSIDTSNLTPQVYDDKYIYGNYKRTIAEIVAYIEVYEHDLPAAVMVQIAELFQTVALYEVMGTSEDVFSKSLFDIDMKITQSLYKYAICLFVKKIYEYKRTFKRFKYKGVMLEEDNFVTVTKKMEKDIVTSFTKEIRKCYKTIDKSIIKQLDLKQRFKCLMGYSKVAFMPTFKKLKKEPYFPIEDVVVDSIVDIDLKDTYDKTKKLLQDYEKIAHKVISNGARQPIWLSIFIAVSGWIIPIALGIPVVLKITEIVKEWFYN